MRGFFFINILLALAWPALAVSATANELGTIGVRDGFDVAMLVAQIVSALAIPIIAFAAWWVAREQQHINSARLRHELFDRRFEV